MNTFQKLSLGAVIVASLSYVSLEYCPNLLNLKNKDTEIAVQEVQEKVSPIGNRHKKVSKPHVNVYFLGTNNKKQEVYKLVKRNYNKDVDGTKLHFAIMNLIKGPSLQEKSKGIYSEIPLGTAVISIEELSDKVIINLNSEFENGGGTDSLYKRLAQLIKTAKLNTQKPIFLYIEGKQADVIGGEGLMLTQPLNEDSLNG